MNSTTQFCVFADHGQFFLLDSQVLPEYPEFVDEQHIEDRLQVIPNLIAVYTTESHEVEVVIHVLDSEPRLDEAIWQHITRCTIDVPSGSLVLAGCADFLPECPRVQVSNGLCGVIIVGNHLDQSPGESYHFYIWPTDEPKIQIIKRYGATA
jgi:hypothetical protein